MKRLNRAQSPEVIAYTNKLIIDALKRGAGEIHILPSEGKIRYKVGEELCDIEGVPEDIPLFAVADRIKAMAGERGKVHLRIESLDRNIEVRVSQVPSGCGEVVIAAIFEE